MAQFYNEYKNDEILQPLVAELSWTKHIGEYDDIADHTEIPLFKHTEPATLIPYEI